MNPNALQVFVLQDGQLVASEVFSDGAFEIGSDPECDLYLASELISPVHAVLQFKDGKAFLIDQGTAAGTLVNGVVIAESPVTSADDIHIGPFLLKIRQLAKRRASSAAPPSGFAGVPGGMRPRPGPTPSVRATRVSSPLMPTPRPGGMAAPLARALAPMPKTAPTQALITPPPASVIPLRPSPVIESDVDVDALLRSLDAAPAKTTPLLWESTLVDAPATARWTEVPHDDEALLGADLLVPIAEEVARPAPRVDDLSEVKLPAAPVVTAPRATPKNVDAFPQPRPPMMVPAPPLPPPAPPVVRPVPVIEPQKAAAPSAKSTGPEVLRVRVLWGRHNVVVRSFAPGETVVAEASEAANVPLYGFPFKAATTLAEPTATGWRITPPLGVAATARDGSGRWQPAASMPQGITLPLGGAIRLSVGDVHVEFVRQLPPALPKGSFGKHDWVFLSILFVMAVGISTAVKLMPVPPKAEMKTETKRAETIVRAIIERKKEKEKAKPPPPPKKEEPKPVVAEKPKPVEKPIAQAETLKAATESIKVVDKVATATKEIDHILSGLNKIAAPSKGPGGGKGAALAGLGGIPSIPNLNGLGGTGKGGGIGDLNGLGGPLTKGAGSLGGAGGLGSGTAGTGQVRGVPVSVPKRPSQVQGQIDRDALARVINDHVNEMRNCYERALLRDPNVGAGKVTLEWTIGTAGNVIDVGTKTSTLKNAEVVSCLLDVVRGLKFPKPDGGVVIVSYPILFNSVGY